MTSVLQKLVEGRFDNDVRIRILPIVMQWLESKKGTDSNGKETLRLRGETVGLIALNTDPNLAATMMAHLTIYEEWKWCSTSLCVNPAVGPVHSGIGYELTVPLDSTAPAEARSSEIILASGFTGTVFSQIVPSLDPSRYLGVACDPLPSSTSVQDGSPSTMTFTHLAENTQHMRTNRVLCGFFALADGPNSSFTYRVGDAIAAPPASAAASAVVNNPLAFDLFQ